MSFFQDSGNYKKNFKRSAILRTYSEKFYHTFRSIRLNAHRLPGKKACPLSSFKKKFVKNRGSITAEASVALPLFLFAAVNLLSMFEIMELQSNVNAALHQVGKEMAVYAYAYDKIAEGDYVIPDIAVSVGFTEIYVRNRVKNVLGKNYVDNSPVMEDDSGLNYSYSSIMKEELIDLVADYGVKPVLSLMGFQNFRVRSRCRMRAWTGYSVEGGTQGESMVYVTESGTVYHFNRNCTYLCLSVKSVLNSDVEHLRNQSGGKYYACELCGDVEGGTTVFITDYGSRFHGIRECSGLKRTVFTVAISQVGGKTPCHRCG